MIRILKYLRHAKAAVAAIMALLILQAYCDLALPNFTSKIVDVGIQQGGIEQVAPEVIRESELMKLSWLMKPEEKELVGRGVNYCAACDGMFYKGKTVVIVGGGNSAVADALILKSCPEGHSGTSS